MSVKLYHYTTPEGLIGIIEKRVLWATNVFYMNDSQEFLSGVSIAQQCLTQLIEPHTDKSVVERIEWLKKEIKPLGPLRSIPIYACSLSKAADVLSQWRAYCSGGGFAIGFPNDLIKEIVIDQKFSVERCLYDVTEQEKIIQAVISDTAGKWLKCSAMSISKDETKFQVSNNLQWEITRTSARIKHASFSEEREWRIVSTPEQHLPYKPEQMHFRSKGGIIIPYREIRLPEHDDSNFWNQVHIIVGPTPHPEQSKASVKSLYRRHIGTAVRVDNTNTPYREW